MDARKLLLPISWLYGVVVDTIGLLYKSGIKKATPAHC